MTALQAQDSSTELSDIAEVEEEEDKSTPRASHKVLFLNTHKIKNISNVCLLFIIIFGSECDQLSSSNYSDLAVAMDDLLQ